MHLPYKTVTWNQIKIKAIAMFFYKYLHNLRIYDIIFWRFYCEPFYWIAFFFVDQQKGRKIQHYKTEGFFSLVENQWLILQVLH